MYSKTDAPQQWTQKVTSYKISSNDSHITLAQSLQPCFGPSTPLQSF